MSGEVKKKFKVPDTFVIIFMLMAAISLLTYVIPAGQYETVVNEAGRSVVDPLSYHLVDKTPITVSGFLMAIYNGCMKSAGIIFMILLLGAYASIINETGALSRGISSIVKRYDKKALYAIPPIMVVLSLLGASAVIVDACIAFVPVGLLIAKKLKLDAVAGAAIIYLGCYAGWNTSFMAAITVQLGQEIAGLPLLSGLAFRFVVYVIFTIITIAYVLRYCRKLQQDRTQSVMSSEELKQFDEGIIEVEDTTGFSFRDAVILVLFLCGIGFYIYGTLRYNWSMDMMTGIFMAVALLSGIVGGLSPDRMSRAFMRGINDMALSAILVGCASSLAVIMNSANIIHSIIYGCSLLMAAFPGAIAAVIMFYVNLVFNFFVTSGPAQGAIVMPIMAPLADVIGVTRQVAVLCFQYGDGLSNCIVPTSGVLMGVIGMAKVPLTTWLKFMLKLFAIWVAFITLVIIVAVLTGYR